MTAESSIFSSCSPVTPNPSPQQQLPGWNESSDALYHERRPTRTQHRIKSRRLQLHMGSLSDRSWGPLAYAFLLLGLLICVAGADASLEEQRLAAGIDVDGMPHEALLFDTREPPTPTSRIARRDESIVPSSTITASGDPAATTKPLETAGAPTQSALPRPFDSSLGDNFTSPACPAFFNSFLSNGTFQDCLPFSLLLQTSNSFFAASRSLVSLTHTLDATCHVNFTACSALMASLAQQIQGEDACGADLQLQNPMAQQAYAGFVAYAPLYHAGCAADSHDGGYCFAEAVSNATATTGSYVYYLPLGVQLPGGTRPLCSPCLQTTMAIFAQYAGNASQPLADTYAPAAAQIDMTCGPRFVSASVQSSAAAAASAASSPLWILVTTAMLLRVFLM